MTVSAVDRSRLQGPGLRAWGSEHAFDTVNPGRGMQRRGIERPSLHEHIHGSHRGPRSSSGTRPEPFPAAPACRRGRSVDPLGADGVPPWTLAVPTPVSMRLRYPSPLRLSRCARRSVRPDGLPTSGRRPGARGRARRRLAGLDELSGNNLTSLAGHRSACLQPCQARCGIPRGRPEAYSQQAVPARMAVTAAARSAMMPRNLSSGSPQAATEKLPRTNGYCDDNVVLAVWGKAPRPNR